MPPAREGIGSRAPHGTWIVVHEAQHPHGPWLAERLHGLLHVVGLDVRAVPLWSLLASVRWNLRLGSAGPTCALAAPDWSLTAGAQGTERRAPGPASQSGARLAGIVHCGPRAALPELVQDASYKSAEWNALLLAWLHCAPCPVVNRPRCDGSLAVPVSPAVWRQRAARAGLPIWPVQGMDDRAMPPSLQGPCGTPGLLVTGHEVLEVDHPEGVAPGWPAPLRKAAARAAAAAGCEWLAWTGARDESGWWRVTGATTFPDLRFFGEPALHAFAALITRASAPSKPQRADAAGGA